MKIKQLRTEKGITQEELAKSLKKSNTYISNLETGLRNASITMLKDICLALGYTHKETAQIILKELDLDVELS